MLLLATCTIADTGVVYFARVLLKLLTLKAENLSVVALKAYTFSTVPVLR